MDYDEAGELYRDHLKIQLEGFRFILNVMHRHWRATAGSAAVLDHSGLLYAQYVDGRQEEIDYQVCKLPQKTVERKKDICLDSNDDSGYLKT